jgi:predicted amidophosphoribosyltransferase
MSWSFQRASAETASRLVQWSRSASRAVTNLVLPTICAGCDQDLEPADGLPLCVVCRRAFTMTGEAICPRCAAPTPQASLSSSGCLHCRAMDVRFQHAAALGVYSGQLQSFILRMKQQSGESLALATGKLLARQIQGLSWPAPVDLIAATPTHWTRRLTRNGNPAAALAEAVAAELHVPLALDLLQATRSWERQATLTPARRRRNMRGVFAVSSGFDVRDAHILVVDDVLTTGATANSMTRALQKAGVARTSVAVVARGIGAA